MIKKIMIAFIFTVLALGFNPKATAQMANVKVKPQPVSVYNPSNSLYSNNVNNIYELLDQGVITPVNPLPLQTIYLVYYTPPPYVYTTHYYNNNYGWKWSNNNWYYRYNWHHLNRHINYHNNYYYHGNRYHGNRYHGNRYNHRGYHGNHNKGHHRGHHGSRHGGRGHRK